ncbi:hypothetical protein RF11_02146 [Thelohanellus kitauei]|uniref:Uncharacterized protein n=1 Tax=Thelohanellus kitauei TaxID=669202 RepID=A0A0C2J912_THEKT|nr:hypothetical protein RF11_02146 [Thelohanellus kitauei]
MSGQESSNSFRTEEHKQKDFKDPKEQKDAANNTLNIQSNPFTSHTENDEISKERIMSVEEILSAFKRQPTAEETEWFMEQVEYNLEDNTEEDYIYDDVYYSDHMEYNDYFDEHNL